jgi:integrase
MTRSVARLALRWDDVDLTTGRLSIRCALKSAKDGVPELGDPKTARGRRTLKLSPDALAAPRAQRAQQAKDKMALGPEYTNLGLIFATPLGTPIHPDNLNNCLKAALTRAGLSESYTFHSLRHSAATMMLAAGVSAKTAADRLGHHSAGFTLDRYVHALESLDEDAADRLQDVLTRARGRAV